MLGKVWQDKRRPSAAPPRRLAATLVLAASVGTACTTSVGGQPAGTGAAAGGSTGPQASATAGARPCTLATPEQLPGAGTASSPPPTPGTGTVTRQSPAELAFGKRGDWKNGLQLTVSAPVAYTPSQPLGNDGTGTPVAISMELTNGSDEAVSGALDVEVVSAERPAGSLTDADLDTALIDVAPGKRQQLRLGFRVLDPKNVSVVVTPGADYQRLVFSGAPSAEPPTSFRPSAVPDDNVVRRCFGQGFVAANGIRVAVTLEPADPIGAVAGDTDYRWMKVTMAATNLSTTGQSVSLQPEVENTGAKAVPFDNPAAGIGDSAGGWLPPGRRVAYVQGYKMRSGGVVTVALPDPANSDHTVIWSDS